jgi:hypothetical protein
MRIRGRGASEAQSPWNEIMPGLCMGGHFYTDAAGNRLPAVIGDEFDVVISLYRRSGHGPSEGVEHHFVDLPDAALSPDQLAAVCELAGMASEAVRDMRRVLVRCHSGYNRSGLVTAQTLVNLGYAVDDAIFLIRYHRSRWALNNQLFVDYLETGLDIARLLAGLDS